MEKAITTGCDGCCGISAVITATGMNRSDILSCVENGSIHAVRKGKILVFNNKEKTRLEKLRNEYIGCIRMIRNILEEGSIFSPNKRICRDDFHGFMENNDWFGVKKINAADVFFAPKDDEKFFISKTDAVKLRVHMELWLKAYGMDDSVKLELLMKRLKAVYPVTGGCFANFSKNVDIPSPGAAWRLLDYLCAALPCEITELDDKGLEKLAAGIDVELPLGSAGLLTSFLLYLRENGKMKNGWTYRFKTRMAPGDSRSDAYPSADILRMAYVVFNEEAWEKEGLLQKALCSERYANLWLFVAFHFICGWRGTDIARIPLPRLPQDGNTVRKKLEEGVFDTDSVVNELEFRLRLVPMKPNKTSAYENVPELKLFVPESLRRPMGMILSAAASYHYGNEESGAFIRRAGSIADIKAFFGKNFAAACGNRGFSSRKANKSYLQGIEAAAGGNEQGKPKGYMLAALARSHKGGFGTLPETTGVYLRDANFSGYSPSFIAREMFERGVFSFIPALMMEIYAGEKYMTLSVPAQTQLMAEIGITAAGLDGLAGAVSSALVRSRRAVAEIMKYPEDIRGKTEDILQNIASGNAPGKQEGCLCLMTASGFACKEPERSGCIGCGYEIYTKTVLHCLCAEYARLVARKKEAEGTEVKRYGRILKEAVMPAVSEMIFSIKRLYPGTDLKPLLKTVERGLLQC